MRRWLRRIGALLVALGALWAALSARQHNARARSYEREADDLIKQHGQETAAARAAQERATAAALRAEAALADGAANIELVQERADADFADRLESLNRRLRGD